MKTMLERFMNKISHSGECWIWTGARYTSTGYPMAVVDGKNVQAHRLAYRLFRGEFDPALHVCHTCDVPLCVNPDHLFLGTAKDNLQDCAKKGRLNSWNTKKTACPQGHPLSGENLYTTPKGYRMCRTCAKISDKRYKQRERG
jgi:hypothetical protein